MQDKDNLRTTPQPLHETPEKASSSHGEDLQPRLPDGFDRSPVVHRFDISIEHPLAHVSEIPGSNPSPPNGARDADSRESASHLEDNTFAKSHSGREQNKGAGHPVSPVASLKRARSYHDAVEVPGLDLDAWHEGQARPRIQGLEAAEVDRLLKIQNDLTTRRVWVQERRKALKILRDKVGDADRRFMDTLRISWATGTIRDDDNLGVLYRKCEAARDALGPEEDSYEISEIKLGAAEFEFSEMLGRLITAHKSQQGSLTAGLPAFPPSAAAASAVAGGGDSVISFESTSSEESFEPPQPQGLPLGGDVGIDGQPTTSAVEEIHSHPDILPASIGVDVAERAPTADYGALEANIHPESLSSPSVGRRALSQEFEPAQLLSKEDFYVINPPMGDFSPTWTAADTLPHTISDDGATSLDGLVSDSPNARDPLILDDDLLSAKVFQTEKEFHLQTAGFLGADCKADRRAELSECLLEFSSTHNRVDRWILHQLRVSMLQLLQLRRHVETVDIEPLHTSREAMLGESWPRLALDVWDASGPDQDQFYQFDSGSYATSHSSRLNS